MLEPPFPRDASAPDRMESLPRAYPSRLWIYVRRMLVLGLVIVSFLVGLLVGSLFESRRLYNNRFQEERARIEAGLARHGQRFNHLQIDWLSSTGKAGLYGSVPSVEDRHSLAREMARIFGDEEGAIVISNVEVSDVTTRRAAASP